MENTAHQEPSKLSYQFLKKITNDFHDERFLGSGTFGKVYKGVHENGGQIAVKVLHKISAGLDDKEFQKELNNLRGLKHQNVVELVGFCDELEQEPEPMEYEGKQVTAYHVRQALCFEYVHNGSLDKYISDECTGLNWRTRYKIIKGMCEGLKYLREALDSPVLHFDLKPDNILLDENMVPKVADFGLSRVFGEDNTAKTLNAVGTRGYLPPEYINHQVISKEFDIFSLGVIIVKIMTGHEGYKSIADMTNQKFVKQVHENWTNKLRPILSHKAVQAYGRQVKRCVQIALDCLKPNRCERPTIHYIVSSLNETEVMIAEEELKDDKFDQEDGESSLPSDVSNITIKSTTSSENFPAVEPKSMSFSVLKEITDDFCQERSLGFGSHGRVYKGVHVDGQVIAVKKLYYVFNHKHLQHDIAIHMKLRHQNIVQYIGFCQEAEKQIGMFKGKYILAEQLHNVLCFEYLGISGSLDKYISQDMDSGFDWNTRYKIIKGVCEGVRYLHEGLESPILHMNLQPSNILMDEKMMPKIGGFGYARLCGVGNSSHGTMGMVGGGSQYCPPDFIYKQVTSKEFDIYSLGVITLELVTGEQAYRESCKMPLQGFIDMAHEKWRERLQRTVDVTQVEGYCQQVKKCLEIAMQCVEIDGHKRPAIADIVHALSETETSFILELDSDPLLHVYPLELSFMSSLLDVHRKKKAAIISSSCLLQLENKGNDRLAFMLVPNSTKRYLTKEPLCGVVPPRCAYTLTLTVRNNKRQPSSTSSDSGDDDFFTLYTIRVGKYDLLSIDKQSLSKIYNNFFKKAKEEVQEVKLKVICGRPAADQGTPYSKPTRPTAEIITTADAQQVYVIDVHPTKPWIMTTNHLGTVRVWDYRKMTALNSFQLEAYEQVNVAKFITREKWIVIGDRDGAIFVYNYENNELESFDAHESSITTLEVHPTSPFMLSSSKDDNHLIKLWDWGVGWKCTREFEGHTNRVTQVAFNPENNDNFASASLDGTIKIWSICSDVPNNIITLKLHAQGLCVDYFTRCNQQHLIVGCMDMTPQIWNLGMKEPVHKLEGHEDRISVVSLHPDIPILITGSLDGTVHVWDSASYKLENIISFNLGAVNAFGCIKGSSRIVVGCHQGIAMLEISFPFPEYSLPTRNKYAMAARGITLQKLPKEQPLDIFNKITDNFPQERLEGTGAFGSVYEENHMANILSHEKELSLEWDNGALSLYNMCGLVRKKICDLPRISLSDLQKLNRLRSIHFKRCDDIFSAQMCDSVVLRSVENLHIEELLITGELFSKVLRCFPALSQLTIQECNNLELLHVEDGGLSDLKLLQSFTGYDCEKFFSRWPTGIFRLIPAFQRGRADAIKPFHTSLRELNISFEPSMQSMGLISNLTSLTSLSLTACRELTMHGFNPLIAVNLKKLHVDTMYMNQEGISIAGDLLSEIARSRLLHAGSFQLEELWVDNISAVLTAPLCSHLAATLNRLDFSYDQRMTTFTAEQEKALQLLTYLQILEFRTCLNLQSVPQGLDGLSSLKRLLIYDCKKILSLPPKEVLPTSLEKLEVRYCSPEITEQAEKMKAADPWFLVEVRVMPQS